jgi:hypothetical protein
VIELLLQAERAMAVGLVEQAERLYWQAIESDRRNAIAVVGLARVAIERNDRRTAYQFAIRALDIDKDNEAARRLVERLTEVMEHKGERLPEPPQGELESPFPTARTADEAEDAAAADAAASAPTPEADASGPDETASGETPAHEVEGLPEGTAEGRFRRLFRLGRGS